MSRWFAINDGGFRAAATERRNRGAGGSTVRVYATTAAMQADRSDSADAWASVIWVARQAWQIRRDDAHEDYLRAVFPERYEGYDEI